MVYTVFFLALAYFMGIWFSPFPYWKTYRVLWKTLLLNKTPEIDLKSRLRQAGFLIKYLVLCPLWTLLWLLDNLLYPEYRKTKIRPVFIVGQPRSGTTFLHRTLAADKNNFLAVPHLEWRYPFIFLQKLLNKSGVAQMMAGKNYWTGSTAGQVAARMHPNKLSDWEEDGIFFEECFLHHLFVFFRFPYPDLLTYLDDFPALPKPAQEKILKTHHQVIQKIMFLRGGSAVYYLSKEVTSHNKFPGLLRRYPGARFVFCLRPSDDFMSSLISLVKVSTQSKTGVDPKTIPSWEAVFLERMQKDSRLLVNLCQNTQNHKQITLLFDRFSRDPVSAVVALYNKFDLPLSSSYRDYLQSLHKDQKTRERGYEYEKKHYPGFEMFDRFIKEKAISE